MVEDAAAEEEEGEEEPAPLASMESAGTEYPSMVSAVVPDAKAADDWQAKEEL